MSKAYLAWPVRLINDLQHDGTHVTLKYIGKVDLDGSDEADYIGTTPKDRLIEGIARRLKGTELKLNLWACTWSPDKFSPLTCVMMINGLSPALDATRAAVATMRQEKYPFWRPHITMDPSIWRFISYGKLSLKFCVESVGPLTLFVDGKPVHEFV